MARFEWLFYLLIPTLILLHLFVAPYTKVEESFNIQAIHDILAHGIPKENAAQFFTANYDHVSFPGSVPRTFAGALMLSGLSKPWVGFLRESAKVQILVRAVLGLLNGVALILFGRSVQRAFGASAGIWYALLQASQFHVIYYASRTLPNMYAFVFSTIALKCVLDASALPWNASTSSKSYRMSLFLLTVAGVVFRSELAILVATITLYLFLTRRLSIWSDIIPTGLSGLVVGLMISVPIDSFFWQSFPLWPEWTAFYYNTIQGHSADWGVSPWHFYIFNALPRLLMNPLTYLVCIPTALLSPATCGRSLDLLVPLLAFVGIYSVLPHKEWRFIIYAIPGLTAVAAAGASYLWTRRAKNALYALLSLVLVCSVFLSFAASTALLAISSLNYPGGAAVTYLHRNIQHLQPPSHHPLKAYFDNLACQTGVTRFLEDHRGGKQTQTVLDVLEAQDVASKREWVYDKTEDPELLRDPMFWTQFDYVLAERPEKVIGKWEVMHTEYGYSGIKVLRPWQKSGSGREEVSGTGKETDGTFSSRVAAFWRDLEGLLRHSVFRGWWVEIRMEPKIRILANRMEDLVHGEV